MKAFIHPGRDDLSLTTVLAALADPMRLKIVKRLMIETGCQSCTGAAPCPKMAKSTLSHHFRILREAGLVRTVKQGVEHRNSLRLDDMNAQFPGLLDAIMQLHPPEKAAAILEAAE